MHLYYPENFTSTQTYQNSNFTFPHDTALSSSVENLKLHFFNPNYIVPAYIEYAVENGSLTPGQDLSIFNQLKNDPIFSILGVSFIKLKSLEEKLEKLFDEALKWKKTHVHGKYQKEINQYITEAYYGQMMIDVGNMTTVVQLMIINYIVNPEMFINDEFLLTLKAFNEIKMIELPVAITIYLARVIPMIIKLANMDYIID